MHLLKHLPSTMQITITKIQYFTDNQSIIFKIFFNPQKKCGKIVGKCEFLRQIRLWGKMG